MMCTKVPVDAQQNSATNRISAVIVAQVFHTLCVCRNDKRTLLSDGILQREAAWSPTVASGEPPTPQYRQPSEAQQASIALLQSSGHLSRVNNPDEIC